MDFYKLGLSKTKNSGFCAVKVCDVVSENVGYSNESAEMSYLFYLGYTKTYPKKHQMLGTPQTLNPIEREVLCLVMPLQFYRLVAWPFKWINPCVN